jgi:integrase
MFDVEGKIANRIVVTSKVGKRGSTREVPMTPDLIDSLIKFMRRYPEATFVALGTYKNHQRMKPTAVKAYMWYVYKKAGFKMGSSHSGRRTYITNLARTMNNFGLSLRDVQEWQVTPGSTRRRATSKLTLHDMQQRLFFRPDDEESS